MNKQNLELAIKIGLIDDTFLSAEFKRKKFDKKRKEKEPKRKNKKLIK